MTMNSITGLGYSIVTGTTLLPSVLILFARPRALVLGTRALCILAIKIEVKVNTQRPK